MTAAARAPLRVLVVDDDPDITEAMGDLIGLLGHEAAIANDGGAAVDVARRFAPELVLCDLSLPGLDGFGVARALRADPATASSVLVALTGFAHDDVSADLRRAGFDRHVTKPVSIDQLNALLERR